MIINKRHFFYDQHGIGVVSTFFTLSFLGIIFYFAQQVFTFYYGYYDMQAVLESQARKASELKDDEIRKTIYRRASSLNIPFSKDDEIRIHRVGEGITISIQYYEYLVFDLFPENEYVLHEFLFTPEITIENIK